MDENKPDHEKTQYEHVENVEDNEKPRDDVGNNDADENTSDFDDRDTTKNEHVENDEGASAFSGTSRQTRSEDGSEQQVSDSSE
jgi:hypothetical protein